MRVLVAPDAVEDGVTLSAPEVAAQIAAGWARARPDDVVRTHPLTAGGDGFLDAIRATLGGEPQAAVARDPWGNEVPTTWLRVGASAYLEAAPLLGDPRGHDAAGLAMRGSSAGVGDLLLAAIRSGVRRVLLGLGESGTHDAGEGALRALANEQGAGSAPIAEVVAAAAALLHGVEVLVAAATSEPLVGLSGAGAGLAGRPGVDAAAAQARELSLAGTIARTEQARQEPRSLLAGDSGKEVRASRRPHAGAGGGVAFALGCAGARVLPGAEVVAVESGLPDAAAEADLLVTASTVLDGAALDGGVPGAAGRVALSGLVPAVALAPTVLIGRRELAGTGLEAVYPLTDPPRPGATAPPSPLPDALAQRASRVARTWSR